MKPTTKQIVLSTLLWTLNMASYAWHFSSADVAGLHSTLADQRIQYGASPSQFVDLRMPKSLGLHPVAIILHGGCWLSSAADLKNTAALADALRDNGFATWNVEYRSEDNRGGGWPGTFEDVATATDYLRKIHRSYALDLNRVIVIGHSAGGHLALWLAGRNHLSESSPLYHKNPLALRGVIALGGVTDLSLARKPAVKVCGTDVIGRLLGGNEEAIAQHYHEASPIELLPLKVPQILIYGTDDHVTPLEATDAYVTKAKKLGDKIQVTRIPGAAHQEYIVPHAVTWPAVLAAAQSLVHQ